MNKYEFSRLELMAKSSDRDTVYVASTILRQQTTRKASDLLKSLPMNIRIKDYSDLCQELRVKELTLDDFSMFPEHQRLKMFSCHRLLNIGKFVNGVWIPDWSNHNEKKWYPYFIKKNGLWRFDRSAYDYYRSDGPVGFYQTQEKSDFAGKFFLSVYQDWLG